MASIPTKLVNYLNIYGTKDVEFTDLPVDMQREIFSQSTDSLKQLMTVSSDIYKIVAPIVAQKYCSLPLTNREITKYLQNKPPLVGTMYKLYPFVPLKITIYQRRDDHYNIRKYEIRNGSGYDRYPVQISRSNESVESLDKIGNVYELDIQSLYEIYRQRLVCVNFNPYYGKDYVKNIWQKTLKTLYDDLFRSVNDMSINQMEQYLLNHVHSTYDDLVKNLNINNKFIWYSVTALYFYLMMNIQTLNVDYPINDKLRNMTFI